MKLRFLHRNERRQPSPVLPPLPPINYAMLEISEKNDDYDFMDKKKKWRYIMHWGRMAWAPLFLVVHTLQQYLLLHIFNINWVF